MNDLRETIIRRIGIKRKQIEQYKALDDYAKCIWIDGQIFALENLLMDVPSQEISGSPPEKIVLPFTMKVF